MKSEKGPAIIQPLDIISSVNEDGSRTDDVIVEANTMGVELLSRFAEAVGIECEVTEQSGNGTSFSLSSIRRELPFLSGSAWSKNKPKDPSQN